MKNRQFTRNLWAFLAANDDDVKDGAGKKEETPTEGEKKDAVKKAAKTEKDDNKTENKTEEKPDPYKERFEALEKTIESLLTTVAKKDEKETSKNKDSDANTVKKEEAEDDDLKSAIAELKKLKHNERVREVRDELGYSAPIYRFVNTEGITDKEDIKKAFEGFNQALETHFDKHHKPVKSPGDKTDSSAKDEDRPEKTGIKGLAAKFFPDDVNKSKVS